MIIPYSFLEISSSVGYRLKIQTFLLKFILLPFKNFETIRWYERIMSVQFTQPYHSCLRSFGTVSIQSQTESEKMLTHGHPITRPPHHHISNHYRFVWISTVHSQSFTVPSSIRDRRQSSNNVRIYLNNVYSCRKRYGEANRKSHSTRIGAYPPLQRVFIHIMSNEYNQIRYDRVAIRNKIGNFLHLKRRAFIFWLRQKERYMDF